MRREATQPARFLPRAAVVDSAIHRLDPRVKVVAILTLILAIVSTPREAAWAFVAYAAILVLLVAIARLPLKHVFRRLLVVLPVIVLVAVVLPLYGAMRQGNPDPTSVVAGADLLLLWNVAAKSLLATLSVVLLASTTTVPDILSAFERLRVPATLVLILSFMFRYVFVLAEEARRMHIAIEARGYGRHRLGRIPALARLAGALFLRSHNRGERVYEAMLSRGFNGRIRVSTDSKLHLADTLFVGSLVVVALAIRLMATVAWR